MPDLDLTFDSAPPPADLALRARLQARGRRRTRLAVATAAAVLASVTVAVPLINDGDAGRSQQQLLSPPASQTVSPPDTPPAPVPAQTSAPAQPGPAQPSQQLPPPASRPAVPPRIPRAAVPAHTPATALPGPSAAGAVPPRPPQNTPVRPPSVSPSPPPPAVPTVPPTATAATPVNLPMTAGVVQALLAAKAAMNGLPASDYTGLQVGQRYYAYDPTTGMHWAAAEVIASDTSLPAQVTLNDNGGYDLFVQAANGTWTAYDVAMTGIAGTSCSGIPPASITQLWGWAPGTCRP